MQRTHKVNTDDVEAFGMVASFLSHHIKNPLTGISGALGILKSRLPDSAGEHDVMSQVLERISELNDSLDGVVAYGRPVELAVSDVSLKTLLRSVLGRGRIEITLPKEEVSFRGDSALLRQALAALVENAIDASTPGDPVYVTGWTENGFVTIEVADRGCGCKLDGISDMFEPFTTSKPRRLGLGLPLARRIAKAHGGDVSCTVSDDKGTVILLRVPTTVAAPITGA